jgi:Ca-activated chloride channel family protein
VKIALRLFVSLLVTALIACAAFAFPYTMREDAWREARFEHPHALWLLGIVPVVWLWGLLAEDRRTPRLRIGALAALRGGPRGARARIRHLPVLLRSVALAFLVVALARPISVLKDEVTEEKGIDIVIVLDLSGSMRAVLDADAKDLPGQPELPKGRRQTRLDVAKLVVKDFVSRRADRIGVIVFGKNAYIVSPPTRDYHLLNQLVSKLTLNVIDASATAIGEGVGTAVARLRRSDAQSKVVLLLTDGDNNAGKISPDKAIELAKKEKCKVYTVQIGNEDEVEVEDGSGTFGQPRYSRARFPVNPALLQKIAKETGGEFYMATDAKGLVGSMHAVLDQLEKTRFEASVQSFEDLFHLLLVPGVVLVGLDALLRALLLRRFP